ncbi:MAG: carbohydrate ABC transporter substrate-binding protein, partial [Porcipelethomonas sp.]
MNKLKRTLALVATLAISATAFVGCGDDSSSSTSTSTPAESSSSDAADSSDADASSSDSEGGDETAAINLPSGGDKMTILAWNANDVDPMLKMWL